MLQTTIIHELREKYQLTIPEYCVLEAIAFLCLNPKSPVAGWCCASKAYIAKGLGVSKGFVVDAVSTLVDRGLIEKSVDGRLVRITVLYFDDRDRYKSNGNPSDRPTVIHLTDDGNPSDRDRSSIRPPSKIVIKDIKEDISVTAAPDKQKVIDEKVKAFKATVYPFIERYGLPMCKEFCEYWTEPAINSAKLRWEMEKTWNVAGRLARWKKNDDEKKAKAGKFGGTQGTPTAASDPKSYHTRPQP